MTSKKVLALIVSVSILSSTAAVNPAKAAGISQLDTVYVNAYKATTEAMSSKTQKSINSAREAIELLPKDFNWAIGEFSKQVDKVQQPIFEKAYNAITVVQKSPTQANVNTAKAAIDPDMPDFYRSSYSSAVDIIQQGLMMKAIEAYNNANKSQLQGDIDNANTLLDDIKTSTNSAIVQWVDLIQTSGQVGDLNDGSAHTGNYVILSENGSFGSTDAAKPTTIKGNILISDNKGSSVILQNMNVEGTISVNFGAGNVVLNNVKVNGVDITNVGSNSLHVTGNSTIAKLTVEDKDNDAHIVIEGNGTIASAEVLSGAKLEVANSSTSVKPFGDITIAPKEALSDKNNIFLAGTFENVKIASEANVTLDAKTKVTSNIEINAPVQLNVEKGAAVAKVNISTEKSDDKIVLNGNLSNVDVKKAAAVEVKGGTVNISSSTNAVVKVTADTTATVNKGQGTGNVEVKSTTGTVISAPSGSSGTSTSSGSTSSSGSNTSSGSSNPAPTTVEEYNKPNGVYASPISFSAASTNSNNPSLLGPSTGVATVNSDITITAGELNYATLRNLKVYGNIIINGRNGNGGSITLDNVTVSKRSDDPNGLDSGKIIVNDVAEHSLHLINGVTAGKLEVDDNNGARIAIEDAAIDEVEVSNSSTTSSTDNASLELSGNASVGELLVNTDKVEVKNNLSAIQFVQGDGVDLTNVKTDSETDPNLSILRKDVNSETKVKEKLNEINGLYRSSNGVTENTLYNYINNKLRILVENIADMGMTYSDNSDTKIFTLPGSYKDFTLQQRNDIAGGINSNIRDSFGGSIQDLSDLQAILNRSVVFATRELEVGKYFGHGSNTYNINIAAYNVGEELKEAFGVKDGETVSDYYSITPTGTSGDFAQFYNGKIYLMKNFALSSQINYLYGSTQVTLADKEDTPEELRAGNGYTGFNFHYTDVIGLDKDITFADLAKTSTGWKIVVRGVGFDPSDFSFKLDENDLNVTTSEVIPTSSGDKFYIFNINTDLNVGQEDALTISFSDNNNSYKYVKRFTLEQRELQGNYHFNITKGYENGKLQIKALDKAPDYSDSNRKYLLNVELKPYYESEEITNLDSYDFAGMVNVMRFDENGQPIFDSNTTGEIPIVEPGFAQIVQVDGHQVIQIPLTIKGEPKDRELWMFNLSEQMNKIKVDPMYGTAIDFSDVSETPVKSSAKDIISSSIGEWKDLALNNVPSGTKVSQLVGAISVSPKATVTLVNSDESEITDPDNTDVAGNMLIKVTAEDSSSNFYPLNVLTTNTQGTVPDEPTSDNSGTNGTTTN